MDNALGITLTPQPGQPLYQQIAEQVRERIRNGALPPGARLPPTRTLARQLGTTRNTVVRAFDELAVSGWVEAGVGRGTFVRDTPSAAAAAHASPACLPWSRLFSRGATGEVHDRSARLTSGLVGAPLIDLQSLQPPRELLPVDDFRRCVEHAFRTRGPRTLAYAAPQGVLPLREQLAADLERRGVACRPEDVVVTTGSQQALDLVTRALVDPGDTVIVDRCTYAGALRILSTAGAHVAAVPGDAHGPYLDALVPHEDAKALYLMPDGQNPTGAWISREGRHALVEWSRRAGVPLIEDDYAADLDLDGHPMPAPLRALDGEVTYLSTVSKKLIPSLRLGFVVAPEPLRERIVQLKRTTDLCCSALLQYALAEYLDRGYLQAHLQRVVPVYRDRRDALVETLRAHLPAGLEVVEAWRGITVWIPLPDPVDPDAVFAEAWRRGVRITPGTLSTALPTAPSGVRLTATESLERLREGGRIVAEAITAVLSRSPDPDTALEGP